MKDSKNRGWVRLHRKITDNDLWFMEKFTKAQAWVDLFLNANHKDNQICIRGNIIPIKRGQIGWSQITMTKRWKWSRQKVRRFLELLVSEKMVIIGNNSTIDNSEITPRQKEKTLQQTVQQKDRYITTIITINKYDEHQEDKKTVQQTVQQKDSRQYINKNDKNEKNIYKEFSHISYLEEMKKNHAKHIQIIALFIIAKGIILTDKEMAQRIIKRNSRTAQTLTKYKILEVDDVMKEAEKLDKKFKWSLEYILKCLEQN